MSDNSPIVSIIMPANNAVDFIKESVASVITQTFRDWELIVIDDASGDGTFELVVNELVSTDSRIRMIRLGSNGGAAVARNAGIDSARGRYIAFLDSDDLWLPEKLEVQIGVMKDRNCPFSFTAYEKIDESGRPIGVVGVPDRVDYETLLKTNVIGCLTAMYDTQYFGKVGLPLILKRQDFGLWLTLLKRTPYACGITRVLARYRVRAGSISYRKFDAARFTWRLYRDVEHLPMKKSLWVFSNYAVRGVLRYKFPRLARLLGVLR